MRGSKRSQDPVGTLFPPLGDSSVLCPPHITTHSTLAMSPHGPNCSFIPSRDSWILPCMDGVSLWKTTSHSQHGQASRCYDSIHDTQRHVKGHVEGRQTASKGGSRIVLPFGGNKVSSDFPMWMNGDIYIYIYIYGHHGIISYGGIIKKNPSNS